jgi:hypothetical protein
VSGDCSCGANTLDLDQQVFRRPNIWFCMAR